MSRPSRRPTRRSRRSARSSRPPWRRRSAPRRGVLEALDRPEGLAHTMPASRKAVRHGGQRPRPRSSGCAARLEELTREPRALKIDATCAPVAPAPTTSSDGGTAVRRQAWLWVTSTRTRAPQLAVRPAGAEDDPRRSKSPSVRARDDGWARRTGRCRRARGWPRRRAPGRRAGTECVRTPLTSRTRVSRRG